MRALAEVVVATEGAYEDTRLIPQALRADYVRRHLLTDLKGRLEGGSVDDIVLPTVAAYAALRTLGVEEIDDVRRWIEERLDDETDDDIVPSAIAQSLVLVRELATPERIERVRAATVAPENPRDDKRLLTSYAAVLFAASDPALLELAARDKSLGLSVQAELIRAVTREDMRTSDAIVALAADMRERMNRLAVGEGALEAVCLGNAALIELARRQGIGPSAAVRGSPREVDARTVENTELVRDRETAVREAGEARRIGRQATTVLTGILVIVTGLIIFAIAVWGPGDLPGKFGFASGVFGLMSTFIGYFAKKATDAGVPPWPLR